MKERERVFDHPEVVEARKALAEAKRFLEDAERAWKDAEEWRRAASKALGEAAFQAEAAFRERKEEEARVEAAQESLDFILRETREGGLS